MDSENLGLSRRRFLTTTATVVGGAGAIATTWPFISTMTPSARAKAIGAPIEVDIGDMKPGELRIEKWQGKPVWILRRNQQTLEELVILNDAVRDPDSLENQQPDYAKNE